MPCTFDATISNERPHWRSRDNALTPNSTERFNVITGCVGGGCGHCRGTQNGIVWGSSNYVLCLNCARLAFGAPDLHIVRADLFEREAQLAAMDETTDDSYEDTPENLITKRDKDFDPRKYKRYQHGQTLTGKYGCAGYRCSTYTAPDRAIPSGAIFMLGETNRGHLCIACYDKLKTKWDSLPERTVCPYCDRRVQASRMRPVLNYNHPNVCGSCHAEFFMNCPETDGGFILRETAVWGMTEGSEGVPPRRIYASQPFAERHWIPGRDHWYTSQEQADREMFSLDVHYRDIKIAEHISHSIFSYGTNIIKMHGFPAITKRTDLCYGVELEMQPNRTHNHDQLVVALGGKYVADRPYILCRDSSIGAAGVELITLPFTLANHKSDKFMPWSKLLTELRKVGQSGQNNTQCGMHVHINRRALSHLQMGKMLVVINAPEMQELVATVAQRNEASYCRRYFKKVADGGKIVGSHGDALNCSNHKGTVELRIFRGNLRYERVMKNLEFTDALCNYAAEQSIQKVHMPAEMMAWLEDNKGHYPHLVKFLREEYQPTKAYARIATRLRTSMEWESAVGHVNVEPTEGDI
jgi:hypothetical protein